MGVWTEARNLVVARCEEQGEKQKHVRENWVQRRGAVTVPSILVLGHIVILEPLGSIFNWRPKLVGDFFPRSIFHLAARKIKISFPNSYRPSVFVL